MKRGYWIGKIVVMGLIAIGAFTFVTMWLWNWLVPALFIGPTINFWQTLGLLALSKILFSGFGGKKKCCSHRCGQQKRERWRHMTAEERELFKQKIKEKWCSRKADGPSHNEL